MVAGAEEQGPPPPPHCLSQPLPSSPRRSTRLWCLWLPLLVVVVVAPSWMEGLLLRVCAFGRWGSSSRRAACAAGREASKPRRRPMHESIEFRRRAGPVSLCVALWIDR